MERLVVENGVYYIKETPDHVVVGSRSGTRQDVVSWNSDKFAFPFGYINGSLEIGFDRTTHDQLGIDRGSMKYPGRLWLKKKIISFWQYPSTSDLKKILSDFEKTFNTIPMDKTYKHGGGQGILADTYGKIRIDGSWRLDVPAQAASDDENYDGFVTRTNGMKIIPRDEYNSFGYLYSLNSIYSKKPLKGVGEKLRSGGNVNTDTGQQHVNSPLLKKDAFSKMTEKQKRDIYNYFKSRGRLSPDEQRMWQVLNKENVDIYCDGERFLIKENPDIVFVDDYKIGRKSIAEFDRNGFAFGYGSNGSMKISIVNGIHGDIGSRTTLKYAGRIWPKQKIISFWQYPPKNELMKIFYDITTTFNVVPLSNQGNRLDMDQEDIAYWKSANGGKNPYVRGEMYGKIKIDQSWRMDIQSLELETYKDVVGKQNKGISYVDNVKSYLYSIKTIFSDKPLRGLGKLYRGKDQSKSISVDSGQQHVISPMLKNKKFEKLSSKEKQELYNFYANKGRLAPDEERMWRLINKENVDVFFDGKKFIIKENKVKKYFTLEEGTGILRRVL